LESSLTTSGNLDYVDSKFSIGSFSTTGMLGSIDDFLIYDYALSAVDVTSIFNNTPPSNGKIVDYRFNHSIFKDNVGSFDLTSFYGHHRAGQDRNGIYNFALQTSEFANYRAEVATANHRTSSLTLSTWFRKESNSNYATILAMKGTFDIAYRLSCGALESGGVLNFTFSNAAASVITVSGTTPIANNVWYHALATFDNATGTAKVYLNGILEATVVTPGFQIGYSTYPLGFLNLENSWDDSQTRFAGRVDDFLYYNRAVSDQEVTAIYNACSFSVNSSLSGSTLSTSTSGTSYQWVDCNDGNAAITGATAQTFTPSTSGNYAVEVTANGCTSTSNCTAVTISTSGIEEQNFTSFNIYPNPAKEIVTINNLEIGSTIQLVDMTGQIVSEKVAEISEITLDINSFNNGIYFVQILNSKGIAGAKKLVINK
jgi:hypothetical protein